MALFVKLPGLPRLASRMRTQETSFLLYHLLVSASSFTPQSLCQLSVTGWATPFLAQMDPALPVGNSVTASEIML